MAGRKLQVALLFAVVAAVGLLNWLYYRAQQSPQVIEERTRLTRDRMDKNQSVLESYKTRFGRYPSTAKEAMEKGYAFWDTDFHSHAFLYRAAADGQSYVLTSIGPDGDEGTADDIVRRNP